MEYVVSGLAGISTTAHMHRMPKGQAARESPNWPRGPHYLPHVGMNLDVQVVLMTVRQRAQI